LQKTQKNRLLPESLNSALCTEMNYRNLNRWSAVRLINVQASNQPCTWMVVWKSCNGSSNAEASLNPFVSCWIQ